MGIKGLWDVLGDGEIISIADYATRHLEQRKRPLRVAVDEACWRFTNLTPEQVQKIRDGEPAANPVEKTILWRVLRLMKLNIQLLFVYDGPRKPWKRNKGSGGMVDKEMIKLLHQLFDHLKVPYHQAPGEAEAECAALQQRGVVDAVWSDDGDALMFGCRTLIKQHKVGKDRVKDQVRVYTAESILERFDLDQDSLVLFATLCGGDYDTQGLVGCGPQVAKLVCRREYGVAKAACQVKAKQLPTWKEALCKTMELCNKRRELPSDFPNFKALGHYRDPAVSTAEQLVNLRGLRQGWDRPIDQRKLRILLRDRFHFWTRGFLKHIAPLYLTRALARSSAEQRLENLQYGIQRKRTRKTKKDGEDAPAKSEIKVTFSPIPAIEIDLSQQPPEEDWSIWAEKDGSPYDPVQNIECDVLECFLRHGLPEGAADAAPEPPKRKRKNKESDDSSSPAKKKRVEAPAVNEDQNDPAEAGISSAAGLPKKRGRPKNDASADPAPKQARKRGKKTTAAAAVDERPASPPPAVFKLPRVSLPPLLQSTSTTRSTDHQRTKTAVIDLGDSSDEFEMENEQPGISVAGTVKSPVNSGFLYMSPLDLNPSRWCLARLLGQLLFANSGLLQRYSTGGQSNITLR